MSNAPLMPKATAVWLVDNTALTFDQVADFTKMHPLEVRAIADAFGVNPAQVLLAWATRPAPDGQRDVIAIPKAVQPAHVEANAAAMRLALDDASLARLDAAFPAPSRKPSLDIV